MSEAIAEREALVDTVEIIMLRQGAMRWQREEVHKAIRAAIDSNAAAIKALREATSLKSQLDSLQIAGCSGSDTFQIYIKVREVKALQVALRLTEDADA